MCVPEYCKHEILLPKMEAKWNIQGLGHDLGPAREPPASTRQEGTDGRNSQPGRKWELQSRELPKAAATAYQPPALTWMRKQSTQEQEGKGDKKRDNN